MRKIILILTVAVTLVSANLINAQNSDYKWAFGYHVGSFQYMGDYGSELMDFTPFRLFQRFGINRYLSPNFDIELAGQWGHTGYYDDKTEKNLFHVGLKGMNAMVSYKFLGDKKFRPYLKAGLGMISYKPVDTEVGEKSTDFGIPVGLGIDYDISPVASLSLQGLYGLNFGDKYDKNITKSGNDNYFNPMIGLKVHFGGMKDRDKDGIADKYDACPDTPGLVQFNGCPDTDGDGIIDSEDSCPTVAGVVGLKGCPDADGDGIADKDDECPTLKGLSKFNGCPDTDEDGVPDKSDKCPTIAGKLAGCPDKDNDGIADAEDKCPEVAGKAQFKGCPDTDGDGIIDSEDECPTLAGKIKGCPDTDGDGIVDPKDKCPKLAGVAANDGCPEVKKEVKEVLIKAMEGVYFDTNSARIKKESYKILNNVVKVMNENPLYKLQIDGHTDNQGDDDKNLQLSKDRAKSVKDYLISKKVDMSRLFSEGYGETKPKATNDTKEGRSQNRRVEFNVIF
jgi:OmpA-OmpF porin, OOP family